MSPMTAHEAAALERLIDVANRDTGQSRRVANFLLAWWNAKECGGFNLTDLWGLDSAIAADIATTFALINRINHYPDSLGYEKDFGTLVRNWRPELLGEQA